MTLVHPQDPTLKYPFVKDILDPPEKILPRIFNEFFQGKQDYDSKTHTLYRPYEESFMLDAVSSHFTEHIRVNCRSGRKPTYPEIWRSLDPAVIRQYPDVDDLREYIRRQGGRECMYFHAGLCIRLYLGFNDDRKPVKIIDPSAGWGCRMLTAIAAGDYVSQYDGYDPNKNLIEPYKKIMDRLDSTHKCRFFCEPFQHAEVLKGYYDLGVTSPPYFDLEEYSTDPSQSVADGSRTYQSWLENFYIPYLTNLRSAIRPGGKIIIYVSDYSDKGKPIYLAKDTVSILTKKISKPCVLEIEGQLRTHKRTDSPSKKYPRPFFVFRVI